VHDGVWDGKRLISEDWVKKSVTPATDTGWQGLKYGFKWWLYPHKSGELVWMGIGFGGQRLMVFPTEQLIVTFTGWDILKDAAFDAELADRVAAATVSRSCPN
jgi:CubicO group peptidase (beta-lactamase class C family)